MQKKQAGYGLIFWIHTTITLILVFSWLLFSWWLILIGEIIMQLQYLILGGCFLSKAEFETKDACIPYYLKKWRLVKDKEKTLMFTKYYLHAIIIILSLIWQILLNHNPLIL